MWDPVLCSQADKKARLAFMAPGNLCALATGAHVVLGAGPHDSATETASFAGPGPALPPQLCGERNASKDC